MKAMLAPLNDNYKYYGSTINITLDDGSISSITVWIHDKSRNPSERALAPYDSIEEAHENDLCSDNHFESDVCYSICQKIVNALNNEN